MLPEGWVLIYSHPYHSLYQTNFTNLMGIKCYFIFTLNSKVERIFSCLLDTLISYSGTCLSHLLPIIILFLDLVTLIVLSIFLIAFVCNLHTWQISSPSPQICFTLLFLKDTIKILNLFPCFVFIKSLSLS